VSPEICQVERCRRHAGFLSLVERNPCARRGEVTPG
jgi:hypothetical protein